MEFGEKCTKYNIYEKKCYIKFEIDQKCINKLNLVRTALCSWREVLYFRVMMRGHRLLNFLNKFHYFELKGGVRNYDSKL